MIDFRRSIFPERGGVKVASTEQQPYCFHKNSGRGRERERERDPFESIYITQLFNVFSTLNGLSRKKRAALERAIAPNPVRTQRSLSGLLYDHLGTPETGAYRLSLITVAPTAIYRGPKRGELGFPSIYL